MFSGSSTSVGTANIGTGTSAAHVTNIGSNAGGNVTIIAGSTATIGIGVGGNAAQVITIGAAAQTGTISVGASSATGIVNISTGTGTSTVNIATGATNAKAVNIATGAVANQTIIGTATTSATTQLLAGTGGLKLTGGQVLKNSAQNNTYQVLATDQVIFVDTVANGAWTMTLEAAPATGRFLTVIDATGNCAIANLTITGNAGNISAAGTSAATKKLALAFQSINLYWNGTIWNGQLIT